MRVWVSLTATILVCLYAIAVKKRIAGKVWEVSTKTTSLDKESIAFVVPWTLPTVASLGKLEGGVIVSCCCSLLFKNQAINTVLVWRYLLALSVFLIPLDLRRCYSRKGNQAPTTFTCNTEMICTLSLLQCAFNLSYFLLKEHLLCYTEVKIIFCYMPLFH